MSDSAEHLRSFVERIERLEEEIKATNDDKRDVYAEAKGNGFDVKVLKRVIAERRRDANERDEADAIFDLYWQAVHGGSPAPAHASAHASAPAREIVDEFRSGVGPDAPETAGDATDEAVTGGESAATHSPATASEAPMAVYGDSVEGATALPSKSVDILPGGVSSDQGRRIEVAPAAFHSPEPGFPIRPAPPLRPHCQKPDACGSYGYRHCFTCRNAAAEQGIEVAA